MRSVRSIIFVVSLFFVLAPAAPAEEARALLKRAIEAHGGEARLERTKKGHLKAEWKGVQWNGVFQTTWEETFDLPKRYRRTIEGTVNGQPFHRDGAMNGLTGWLREGNAAPSDLSADELVPLEQHWYALLLQLLLLRGKENQLTSLPDETKSSRTFAGLRAVSPTATADLYFDKSTGLLARARRPLPNLPDGQEQRGETVYEDYREIEGIHYPMRWQSAGGNAFSLTIQLSSLAFLDTIEASVFVKPETPAVPSAGESNEETPTRWFITATLSAGVMIGAMWFLVRASKRKKQQTPSS